MTTTEIDEALLVIDVQNEYFTGRLPVTFPKSSLGYPCSRSIHRQEEDNS